MAYTNKKEEIGIVVTDSMDKSVKVRVQHLMLHPLYKKVVKKIKNYIVHDEKNEASVGDKVLIRETRPLSKRKSWRIIKFVEKVKK
jgi:small subunit ribosomal protein S17